MHCTVRRITDTAWFIASSDALNKKIVNVKNGEYEANSVNSVDTCLSPGDYNFTVYDEYGKVIERIILHEFIDDN